jgi:hypothetical protein
MNFHILFFVSLSRQKKYGGTNMGISGMLATSCPDLSLGRDRQEKRHQAKDRS